MATQLDFISRARAIVEAIAEQIDRGRLRQQIVALRDANEWVEGRRAVVAFSARDGSPVISGERLFVTREDGQMLVFRGDL